MLRLGDEEGAAPADNSHAFAQDELDEAGVLLRLDGETFGLRRRRYAGQRDDASFRLRDDLLGYDNDVSRLNARAGLRGASDEGGEVIALADFGEAGDRDDANIYAAARQM